MADQSPDQEESLIDLVTRYGRNLFGLTPEPLKFETPELPVELLKNERSFDKESHYDALVNYLRSAKRGKTGYDPNHENIGEIKINKGDPTLLGALGIIRDLSKNPSRSQLASEIASGISEDIPTGYFPSPEGWTVFGQTRVDKTGKPVSVSFLGGPKGDLKTEGANENTVLHEALHALESLDQRPMPMTNDLRNNIYKIKEKLNSKLHNKLLLDKFTGELPVWISEPTGLTDEAYVRSLTEPTFQNFLSRSNGVSIPAAQEYPLENTSREYVSSLVRDLEIKKFFDEMQKNLEKQLDQKYAENGAVRKKSGGAVRSADQEESLIDLATRYGRGWAEQKMREHPVITRGLASAVTDPLDLVQFLATHGVDPEVAMTMTPEQLQAQQDLASSLPNAGELAQKYLAQTGVRESETLPEKAGELAVSMFGPAAIAKAPEALSLGKRILGMVDEAAPEFSGMLNVVHGSPQKGLQAFRDPSKVNPDFRYDGGDPGSASYGHYTYFDEKGNWVNGSMNRGINKRGGIYDVTLNFDKAFLLTPDNIEKARYVAGIPKKAPPISGEELAQKLKDKGYDGLIVRGFDNWTPTASSKAKEIRDNELRKLIAEGKDWNKEKLGKPLKDWEAFNYEMLARGLKTDAGQDQIISFYPQKNAKILGKQKSKKLPKASGGAVHMGKGGLLKAGAEELAELAAKYLLKTQKITSADTSLRQVPALLKKIDTFPGQRNLDIGGGKYDLGKDFLAEQKVENHVYDPFNRTPEHNNFVLSQFAENPADSVTVANVLNVIKEPKAREDVIRMAFENLKPGGKAYFDIYEGSRSGVGKATSKGWQNNAPAVAYEKELKKIFGDNVIRKGTMFVGNKFASGGAVRKKSGGALSRVNEAGNYTKPGMRKKLFNSIKSRAVQGTKAGQWSARKAQLLAKKYKEQGGGYKD